MNEYSKGHTKSIQLIQETLNKTNASFTITDTEFVTDGIIATMFIWDSNMPPSQSIDKFISYAKQGLFIEVHTNDCENTLDDTLAAFLIGAQKYSYYACSNGWEWPGDWNKWWPEYDKSLGQPTGDAVKKGNTYSRSFKSGTSVTYDVSTNKGTIRWGS